MTPAGPQVHGYTPANEPWELGRTLQRGSSAYAPPKHER